MGLSSRILILVAAYWTAEFVGVHLPQIRDGYPADDQGRYQVSWIMRWKLTQDPSWLSLHALCASISFFLWMLLLSDRVRQWSLPLHRWAGRISLVLFLGSSWNTPLKAWNMAVGNNLNRAIVMLLGILSLAYAVGAYWAIRWRRNIPLHRQLAFRLVFCSAAFVIYGRLVLSILAPFLDEMTAKIYAIPYAAGSAVVGMEMLAYRLELGYPPHAGKSAETYRFLGIPSIGISTSASTDPKTKNIAVQKKKVL